VWSMTALLFASVGYWGSLVFYNAYLPEISSPENHDKVSARGFAMGYLGSSILLIVILVASMVFKMEIKYGFLMVGIWWIGFSQITFRRLPNQDRQIIGGGDRKMIFKGFQELKKVWNEIGKLQQLRRYLWSYFMFNMGVQTVMIMAVPFAAKEIRGLKDSDLIISILLIQFLGIAGSFLMSKLSSKFGNLKTLQFVIFLWILICASVYLYVYEPMHFYIAAACVGLVMGGIQALSRSTYSKMLPETQDHASYFSFYDVSEKIGLAIGTVTFGLIEELTGGIRNSVLSLISFFIIGFVLLLFVPKSKEVQAPATA